MKKHALPLDFRPILEPKHKPIIQHHRHPVDGRCPQLLVKLRKNLWAGGDQNIQKLSLRGILFAY